MSNETYKRLDKDGLQYYTGLIKDLVEGNVKIVSLNETQYNALSTEEKNRTDIIYRLTNISPNQTDSNSSNFIHVYDTVSDMETAIQNGELQEGDIMFTLDLEEEEE